MPSIIHIPYIADMLRSAPLRPYAKGQTILYPEDMTAALYVLHAGVVGMHSIDEEGNRKIFHLVAPPALFPIVSFSAQLASVSWFYTALTDAKVYLLPYEKIKSMLNTPDGTKTYNFILRQLLGEVHELLVKIDTSTKTTSAAKLVAVLKVLCTYHIKEHSGSWQTVIFPVSHQLLADMAGLTRETVSIAMKQLDQDGIVRYARPGKLELHRPRLYKF